MFVPLMWVSSFGARISSIPEDANVICSEEENEMKRFNGKVPLDSSYDYQHPDGTFEYLIEFQNGEVDWGKGFSMQLDSRRTLLIKEGFIMVRKDDYWKTELYLIDQLGYHRLACECI